MPKDEPHMYLFFHVNIGKYLLFLWQQCIVTNLLSLIKLYFFEVAFFWNKNNNNFIWFNIIHYFKKLILMVKNTGGNTQGSLKEETSLSESIFPINSRFYMPNLSRLNWNSIKLNCLQFSCSTLWFTIFQTWGEINEAVIVDASRVLFFSIFYVLP